MIERVWNAAVRLSHEPPIRLLTRLLLKQFRVSVQTRARWDISARPAYLLGLVTAAEQAVAEKCKAFAAIEFGVAGGRGLLALQRHAEEIEREYGIAVRVYGFDTGVGLPALIGDHRDHPEKFGSGDFPMDERKLRAKLLPRTALLLGNVRDTVELFFEDHEPPPIGFASFDMDLYSSTREAFRVFTHPRRRMLLHTPLYFDDLGSFTYHEDAGELLAIREFNAQAHDVKIHPWAGVRDGRPFREAAYLNHMYVAHDLAGASKVSFKRPPATLPL